MSGEKVVILPLTPEVFLNDLLLRDRGCPIIFFFESPKNTGFTRSILMQLLDDSHFKAIVKVHSFKDGLCLLNFLFINFS